MSIKNVLQEYLQRRSLPLPIYKTYIVGGKPHHPECECTLTFHVDDTKYIFVGKAFSKKEAEVNAVKYALDKINKCDVHTDNTKEDYSKPMTKSPSPGQSTLDNNNASTNIKRISTTHRHSSYEIEPTDTYDEIHDTQILPKDYFALTSTNDSKSIKTKSYFDNILGSIKSTKIIICIDIENVQNIAYELLETGIDVKIYGYISEKHPLLERYQELKDQRFTLVVVPSTRKNAADIGMTLTIGRFLERKAFDNYVIVTNDMFAHIIIDCITKRGLQGEVCNSVSRICKYLNDDSKDAYDLFIL